MINTGKFAVTALVAGCIVISGSAGADQSRTVVSDNNQVTRWNRFFDNIYVLHKRLIAGRKIETVSEIGGYQRHPNFYKEIKYYDKETGKLISKIDWEVKNPKRIHAIEVYVYDRKNRLIRDYSAWYLPDARNAPRGTFINLHTYNKKLHAFRQFDASDNRIYEICEGRYRGKVIYISLWELDIIDAEENPDSIMSKAVYKKCFNGLPEKSAGVYLKPRQQFQ